MLWGAAVYAEGAEAFEACEGCTPFGLVQLENVVAASLGAPAEAFFISELLKGKLVELFDQVFGQDLLDLSNLEVFPALIHRTNDIQVP